MSAHGRSDPHIRLAGPGGAAAVVALLAGFRDHLGLAAPRDERLARGGRRVDLDTSEGNPAALALYERLGYRYRREYGRGERQLYLRKELG